MTLTVLNPTATRITKRHKHDWLIPVGEVPRLMGLEGTAQCSKCRMRVRFDDLERYLDPDDDARAMKAALDRLDYGDEGEGCRWCLFSEGHDADCPVAQLHAALSQAEALHVESFNAEARLREYLESKPMADTLVPLLDRVLAEARNKNK